MELGLDDHTFEHFSSMRTHGVGTGLGLAGERLKLGGAAASSVVLW